jgi:hypothetical protein
MEQNLVEKFGLFQKNHRQAVVNPAMPLLLPFATMPRKPETSVVIGVVPGELLPRVLEPVGSFLLCGDQIWGALDSMLQ